MFPTTTIRARRFLKFNHQFLPYQDILDAIKEAILVVLGVKGTQFISALIDPIDRRDLLIWINERSFVHGLAEALVLNSAPSSTTYSRVGSRSFFDRNAITRARKAFFSITNNAYMRNDVEKTELKGIVDEFGAPAILQWGLAWETCLR
jgi:hypothetical protein